MQIRCLQTDTSSLKPRKQRTDFRVLVIAEVELYAKGGLSILAWLEGPGGRIEASSEAGTGAKSPTFPIVMGVNYEVVR